MTSPNLGYSRKSFAWHYRAFSRKNRDQKCCPTLTTFG